MVLFEQKILTFVENFSLPGREAHIKMSPYDRLSPNEKTVLDNARKSAVMVLLHKKNEELYCTLIERPEYNGVHSKQIAFPGGKMEESDESYEHTALRETHEEIGIYPQDIKIITNLTELYISPSNFLVYPFLGILNSVPQYNVDKNEVSEVVEFPLNLLLDDALVSQEKVKTGIGLVIQAPTFRIQNKVVWGATAAILSELKEILKQL